MIGKKVRKKLLFPFLLDKVGLRTAYFYYDGCLCNFARVYKLFVKILLVLTILD